MTAGPVPESAPMNGFGVRFACAAVLGLVACGAGTKTNTESVPSCNGVADGSAVPVECIKALAAKCGSGKAGLIQTRAQATQVSYTCVELSLSGTARFK